jgi:hypothetical protein
MHCLPGWEISHFNRGANTVVHSLAKYALLLGEEKVWDGVTPVCIQDIVFFKKIFPQ